MRKMILLLSLVILGFHAGCGGGADFQQDREVTVDQPPSARVALAIAREWGFARAMNSCRRFQTHCEQNRTDTDACHDEFFACISAAESAFRPLLTTGLRADPGSPGEMIVPPEEIATALKGKKDSDTGMDYAKCMNWCWSSHTYCKKHQTDEIDCNHHLGVCIEACESEFDPQFGGLDLVLRGDQLPVLEFQP
jgi:hypothetical protein